MWRAINRWVEQRRIRRTVEGVTRYLRDKPAIGTSPGSRGWPKLTTSNFAEITQANPDWVTIGFAINHSDELLISVYGNNAQAAWSAYLNGVRVLATHLEKDGDVKTLVYLRKQIDSAKLELETAYKIALEGTL